MVTLLNEAKSMLVWVNLPLSIAALSAEMLPEVQAKILAIATLILIIYSMCIGSAATLEH